MITPIVNMLIISGSLHYNIPSRRNLRKTSQLPYHSEACNPAISL